ncbi:TMV resistance protein N [Malus domestica]|uniref:TMV resistance protein N n=1 Tax=Malus domestica TaxID=3750 RepID=UPI0010AAC67F|nr:TMV resistance protein N [Malus domestica]
MDSCCVALKNIHLRRPSGFCNGGSGFLGERVRGSFNNRLWANQLRINKRKVIPGAVLAVLTSKDAEAIALVCNGINTFIDRHLVRGEEISPAFLKAIEDSRISVIVFSENYASSRWCLDELVHIRECRKSRQQIVWPVFYKVDPSHVRNQTSSFGDAFTGLECKHKDEEKILLWRSALKEVANLSGHTVKEGEYEATFINKIVKEILVEVLQRTYLNVAKYPVGIQSCAEEVEEILDVGENGRCVVGIWGTSGIGKTTIAKAVYNAIAHKFEGSCFLADVRETSTSHEGVIKLQNTLLSKVLRGIELKIDDVHHGISLIEKLLRRKKILLILDDVDELEQLNNLVEVDWFGEGSRVIITTKDRGLLESYGVKLIYKVQKLENDKALELLSLNAFTRKEPSQDYLSLARRAIAYAQGLPLALNLIGSYLRNKNIDRWQAILDSYNSYEGEPYRGIQRTLRKSYDAWDYVVQQVFLDIACFFKGEDKDYVLQVLRSSKLNVPEDCIEVLVENAIITIEDNRILMHDLLEKMGKRIVREESPNEPGKRSRLWFHEDVYNVLIENQGTWKIKGIVVKLPEPDVIPLNPKSFLRMVNLEFFINRNARFSGHVDYLPNNLRWIELDGPMFHYLGSNILQKHTITFNLPSNYHPRNLVTFYMPYSGIRQLKGFKNLAKLTSMNLSGCEFLKRIPDLSGSPNLRDLNLSNCKSLVEVDDSIGFLDKLEDLSLRGCSKLMKFATRLGLRSLQVLSLCECTRLKTFPEIEEGKMESLWYLDIEKSGIRKLPSSFAYLTGLGTLKGNGCENLTNISLRHYINVDFLECSKVVTESQLLSTDSDDNCITLAFPKLHYLGFRGCNLSESDFLVPFNCWSTLAELDLSRNNFVSLPDCISKFVNLETLSLSGCKRFREIPQVLPSKLVELYLDDCTSLEKIPPLPPMLRILDLCNCFGLSGDEVEKLKNNLLNFNQERLWWSNLQVFYQGNEVPKWFSYTSNHPTPIRIEQFMVHEWHMNHPTRITIEQLPVYEWKEEFVGGSEFCFEIPLNLQVGETLFRLALSFVFEPPTYHPHYTCILINRVQQCRPMLWDHNDLNDVNDINDIEATHVWLALVDLKAKQQQGDNCQVIFYFPRGARIKSCGLHFLLRNQDKHLHLSLGPTNSLGKRPRPHGLSDIVDDSYDPKQQWFSLSSTPMDDHSKHRQIDLNVPIDIEEEQEQPSTPDDPQFLIY